MGRHVVIAVAAALLAAVGCSPTLDLPGGAHLGCPDGVCPEGLVCVNARCVAAAEADLEPPDFSGDAPPQALPAVGNAETTFAIRFGVTEPLDGAPRVTLLRETPVELPCTQDEGPLAFLCTYLPPRPEPGDSGGDFVVDVLLRDLAGNETLRRAVATLRLDFRDPGVVQPLVTYVPPPESVLEVVEAAGCGARILVTVLADESLDQQPSRGLPTLVARRIGGAETEETLEFLLTSLSPGAASFEAWLDEDCSLGSGDYAPLLTWSDLAGNRPVIDLSALDTPLVVRLRTGRPVLRVDQQQVAYLRSPWGNASAEQIEGRTVPAGPVFELTPADPLSPQEQLPASTFGLADDAPLRRLRVWSSGAQDGSLPLASVAPSPDGGWPRVRLEPRDVPTVFVSGVDAAGNESERVPIEHAEWVATASSGSGHQLLRWTNAGAALHGGSTAPEAASAASGSGDGRVAAQSSSRVWRDRSRQSSYLIGRLAHGLAFDRVRGRGLLFGGYSGEGATLDDFFEWDGELWRAVQRAQPWPAPVAGAALAWDAARGRAVLFGGRGADGLYIGTTWLWDGRVWSQAAAGGPGARSGHAMAFDAARGMVVLFGGQLRDGTWSDETWSWDGERWSQLPAQPLPKPAARSGHAMAFDAALGKVVLAGGSAAATVGTGLWAFDGATWSELPASGGPASLSGQALVFDEATGRLRLLGEAGQWWLDGDVWRKLDAPARGPSPSWPVACLWDSVRAEALCTSKVAEAERWQQTWSPRDGSWRPRAPASLPRARLHPALARSPDAGGLVMFGGSDGSTDFGDLDGSDDAASPDLSGGTGLLQDTWLWNGGDWSRADGPGPAARWGAGLAYDPVRGRTVLFGGRTAAGLATDTWEWDGREWAQLAPDAAPQGRVLGALAWDGAAVVLFGGRGAGNVALNDLWRWNGTQWTASPASGTWPQARFAHAMTEHDGKVALFGGLLQGEEDAPAELWVWSRQAGSLAGGSWERRAAAPGSSWPASRAFAALVADPERRSLLLVGGYNRAIGLLGDLWEYAEGSDRWAQGAVEGGPGAIDGQRMCADGAGRFVSFGGIDGGGLLGTWVLESHAGRRPALQLAVDGSLAGIEPGAIEQLQVRAVAGGCWPPAGPDDRGVELFGWSSGFSDAGGLRAPGWVSLGENLAGSCNGPAPFAVTLDQTVARSLFESHDRGLNLQARPRRGVAGVATEPGQEAVVALDYFEVRVRYRSP